MKAMQRLRIALGLSLVATLAAAFWPLPDAPPDAGAAAASLAPPAPAASTSAAAASAATHAPEAAAPALRLPDRSAYARADARRDPFALPAPPPPAAAPAPPVAAAPAPPSIPWAFAGRLRVPGQPDAVLLHDGPRTLSLVPGAELRGWRLDADLGARLEFTHLESGTRSVLPLTP
jgi:hypothetical protein